MADIRALRDFAEKNVMGDEVVRCFLEEALIHQHGYMSSGSEADLENMSKAVESAGQYVSTNSLSKWESRLARFLGRIADYRKEYSKAQEYYQQAIDKAIIDPDYATNPAIVFEYRGFKIMDQIKLGYVEQGIAEAKALYEEYLFSEDGKSLRTRDYATWAIWRSGVFINLARALTNLGLADQYKVDILGYLEKADQDLRVPEGVSSLVDFGFRKEEIKKAREALD